MAGSGFRKWLSSLFQPSSRFAVATLVGVGLLIGLAGVVAFDYTMEATSSEAFCSTSCHSMEVGPYRQVQATSHFNNATGVRPDCADCHIPKEFLPKMIRKVEAAREVWGHWTGIIDTPEKYAAHAPVMKAREIARLKANDSQECRNCHESDRMLASAQSAKAVEYHGVARSKGKTCIDCHAGIAHPENSQPELSAAY